jgi:hypothetical protein
MSNFWPSGLELSDTQSPREILKAAQNDWRTNSNGAMDLVFQDAKSKSGNRMIIVHAKHIANDRTATLFSIVHRPEHPYPATIQLKEDDLPQLLKKSYYQQGSKGIGLANSIAGLMDTPGKTVSNEWVSETPAEFRKKLADAFNSGLVKSEVLNLASISTENTDSTNGEPLED